MISTIAALIIANGKWAALYFAVLHHEILGWSLLHAVNDGLMAIFFYTVGLELRHEIAHGELRDVRKAALPILAALGGMIGPALIYLALAAPETRGWPVPMATDIAFALGVLALLGPRVPGALRTFLLTLATIDDLGAIAVIALVFTTSIRASGLALAAVGFAMIVLLRRISVRGWIWYLPLGIVVWYGVLRSGIHATCAGVALGLLTPPGERLIARLQPWISRLVLPLFALANSGVALDGGAALGRVSLAVFLSLVVGKPLGILIASWLALRTGAGRRPAGVGWPALLGAGCLGGIGFTMAIFMANLSLDGASVDAAKAAVLGASLASATLGALVLFVGSRTSSSRPG